MNTPNSQNENPILIQTSDLIGHTVVDSVKLIGRAVKGVLEIGQTVIKNTQDIYGGKVEKTLESK